MNMTGMFIHCGSTEVIRPTRLGSLPVISRKSHTVAAIRRNIAKRFPCSGLASVGFIIENLSSAKFPRYMPESPYSPHSQNRPIQRHLVLSRRTLFWVAKRIFGDLFGHVTQREYIIWHYPM